MSIVTVARHAMATRFEIVLHGEDEVRLRAAGEEALDEIGRIEAQLSLYRPSSEIAQLNARAAHESVRVTPSLFKLLTTARQLNEDTRGAFDITIAPLMRCWGFMGGTGQRPDSFALARARECVGMHLVELNEQAFTVRFARPGVMLDLGAIGKGYAIDRAAELLREAGITSALLHGGTSTIYGLGRPLDSDNWKVAIVRPENSQSNQPSQTNVSLQDSKTPKLQNSHPPATLVLEDEALSVSAWWGKSFQENGKNYGHVIDPRTGEPASEAALAAVLLPDATETDALSTALLTLGPAGQPHINALRPNIRTLLATNDGRQVDFCATAPGRPSVC